MEAPITLSIVIPSFNNAADLDGALQSIAAQTFTGYEVVIVDANSRDETAAVVGRYPHLPIRFDSEPDKGIYDAINKGIGRSRGTFVYVMGCDDRLYGPDVLATVFAKPSVVRHDVIYGDVILSSTGRLYGGRFTYFRLIQRNICHQAMFVRKTVFDTLGTFLLRYPVFADWEFNMRWFGNSVITRVHIPVVVARYTDSGFSSHQGDVAFQADYESLLRKHLPWHIYYLHANAKKVVPAGAIRLLKKSLKI